MPKEWPLIQMSYGIKGLDQIKAIESNLYPFA